MSNSTPLHRQIGVRLNRLLAGERRIDDLDRIFLALRDRSFGNWFVRDLGDFVAHSDKRDKGPIWARATTVLAKAHLYLHNAGNSQSRQAWEETIRFILLATPESDLQEGSGLERKQLLKIVNRLFDEGPYITADGRPIFSRILTNQERRAFEFSVNTAALIQPVIDQSTFLSQLVDCLKKNHLLDEHSEPTLRAQSDFLTVYAAVQMHQCILDMPHVKSPISLRLSRCPNTPLLSVDAIGPLMDEKNISMVRIIFKTDVPLKDCVEDADMALFDSATDSPAVELCGDGKIRILRA